jgi:hypothetical protein
MFQLDNPTGLVVSCFIAVILFYSLRQLISSLNYAKNEIPRTLESLTFGRGETIELETLFDHIKLGNVSTGITLCTLFGLFGTFLGMSDGLSGIGTEDIKKITEGATLLIRGMSSAFVTSLVGIFSSIALMIAQGIINEKISKSLISAKEHVKSEYSHLIVSPLLLLKIIASAQAAQDTDKMSSAIESLSKAAAGFNLDALGAQIGKSLETSIEQHMMPPLVNIANEVRDLRDSHERQREEILKSVINELQAEVFEPMSRNISSLADQLIVSDRNTQNLITSVDIVANDIRSVNDQVNVSLSQMQQTQQNTLEALRIFLSKLKEELTRTEETIRSTTQSSLTLLEQQQETFKQTAHQASDMLTIVREDTRQMLEEGVKKVALQAGEILHVARTEVEEGLKAVPEMLSKTREETQIQLTAFRTEYQERLQAFFNQQTELLDEVLGSQSIALSEVVQNLRAAFEDEYNRRLELGTTTAEQLEDLSASAKQLDALNTSLSAQAVTMLPKIAEASQGVAVQLQSLHNMYSESNRTFADSAQQFGDEVSRVVVGLQDRQDVLFKAQDDELSKILTHLIQVTTLLNQTATEVRNTLQVVRYDR